MNKELLTKKYDKGLESVAISEDTAVLKFGDVEVKLEGYHEGDCCEHVYADFSPLEYLVEQAKGANKLIVKGVDKMGFLLCFEDETASTYSTYSSSKGKVFIPCYNEQNGYYSSDLELVITENGVVIRVDISDLVEDRIE